MPQRLEQAHQELIDYALSFPGTREDTPWGERVAKVGAKVFVFFGRSTPGEPRLVMCVKLPKSGLSALDRDFCVPANYGMGKHGWVLASFDSPRALPMDLLRGWIDESYRAIAPKRLVAQLDASRAPAPGAPRVTRAPLRKKKARKTAKRATARGVKRRR